MAVILQTTFEMNFLEWKFVHLDSNFTEICLQGPNWQASISSDNGLVPNRQQDIIWTNDGLVFLHKFASLGLNELMGA